MKNELVEEILRMRLLSNYDMKSTLTENKKIILERAEVAAGLKSAEEIARLEKQLVKSSGAELRSALEQGLSAKKFVLTASDGVTTLRTADEMISALKAGKLAPIESGKLYRAVFRNSKDPALLKKVAEVTVEGPTFVAKYGNLNKEGFMRLTQSEMKIGKEQAEALWQANRLRLSRAGQAGKVGKGAKTGVKSVDDVVGAGRAGANQSQKVVVKNYLGGFKEADDLARKIGPEVDDIAKSNGFKNADDWFRKDPKGMYRYARESGESGRGVFGRIVDWRRRNITWRALKTLGILVGGSWLVWYLFFREDDFNVECDPGFHFEEGKGCIADGEGGGDEDDEDDEGGEGGGGTPGEGGGKVSPVGPNGEKLQDNEGVRYEICDPPYYKGCVNKKGNTDIKKVQDCLGVTPNGFFNQETEDALKLKINKKSFTPSDINTICATSYGGASFRI